MLCIGGPIRYKIKACYAAQITDDWLFTNVCPQIRVRFDGDRRLCMVLASALLYTYCNPATRDMLGEYTRIRMAGAFVALNLGADTNLAERFPLNIYQVAGNLCIDDMMNFPEFDNGRHTVAAEGQQQQHQQQFGGGNNCNQTLQALFLQVQQCRQAVSLLHMQIDIHFENIRNWRQGQNAVINSNIRRLGGTIQGAFARQDPTQVANRRNAAATAPQQHHQELVILEDGAAELSPHPRTLMDLWHEWRFGQGGRKPTEQFTARERGNNGDKWRKQKYYRRKKVWMIMERLIREGITPQQACTRIRQAYGHRLSVTQIINKAIRDGVRVNLIGPGGHTPLDRNA